MCTSISWFILTLLMQLLVPDFLLWLWIKVNLNNWIVATKEMAKHKKRVTPKSHT